MLPVRMILSGLYQTDGNRRQPIRRTYRNRWLASRPRGEIRETIVRLHRQTDEKYRLANYNNDKTGRFSSLRSAGTDAYRFRVVLFATTVCVACIGIGEISRQHRTRARAYWKRCVLRDGSFTPSSK